MHKQIDGVATVLPLGLTLGNSFLFFFFLEKTWLDHRPDEFKPIYYKTYLHDIFILFKSEDHLTETRNYLNKSPPSTKLSFEQKRNGKYFLRWENFL